MSGLICVDGECKSPCDAWPVRCPACVALGAASIRAKA
jgi:hypothetical protein